MEAEGRLMPLFGFLDISPDAVTEPVGMPQGTKSFVNELIVGDTSLSYDDLLSHIKDIEQACGKRTETQIPLDIDILQYDGKRYHEADWQRSYIQDLMALMQP